MLARLAGASILVLCAVCAPGQSSNLPPAPSQSQESPQKQPIEGKEQSQRMLGVLPQFGVTDRKDAPPLAPREKFRLFYRTAFDPMEFVLTGAEAGISQAENEFPDYGQGASGYGKRFGAAFTGQATSNFFGSFVYPVLLKEDPRYFRLRDGSFKKRLGYSLVQVFIAHRDSGGRTFGWSNALGALTAGGIANAYYPAADRGFGLTMSRAGISLLYGSLGGIGSEFWPDVARKLHRRRPALPMDQQTQK